MSMTGHDPRDSAPYLNTKVGIGGEYATRDRLIEWMDLIGRKDTPIRPLDVFVTLLNYVDEGAIKPIRRVSVVGQGGRLDPFCTIIAEADALDIFNSMRNPVAPSRPAALPEKGVSHIIKNPPGKPPEKRQAIARQMVADYRGKPDLLASEKQLSLANNYGGSRETVSKARVIAMMELRQNSDTKPITDR